MKGFKLQHRVTRTRVKGSKLLEFGCLQRSLWIRRVLVRAFAYLGACGVLLWQIPLVPKLQFGGLKPVGR
jgi:hypothetical protein